MQFQPILIQGSAVQFIKYENLNTSAMLMKKITETICVLDNYFFLS